MSEQVDVSVSEAQVLGSLCSVSFRQAKNDITGWHRDTASDLRVPAESSPRIVRLRRREVPPCVSVRVCDYTGMRTTFV